MSDLNTCPICGKRVKDPSELIAAGPGRKQHRCREKVLQGIDGALASEKPRGRHQRSEAERLAEGFAMLNQEDE